MNRPDCVERCLSCLECQESNIHEIILVDASEDNETKKVVESYPKVIYCRTDVGYGHMTKSRNLGLTRATGEIVAFIDDDAFAHEGWLEALLAPYGDTTVGGVGGRALNNQPGEETRGVDQIGKLYPSGAISGNFAADPKQIIDVDHLIGCNMSWRRDILVELGGLRDDYPGTEVREETDIALRVSAMGYRLVFNPQAIVTHVGAPQVKGKRFDLRYTYYASRNHAQLLSRNFGPLRPIVWRSTIREIREASVTCARRFLKEVLTLIVRLVGLTTGSAAGIYLYFFDKTS